MPLFSTPSTANPTDTVAIAGGGIAGLASALALARVGWQPVVHEQAAVFAEVGAGVQLGPNVTRILREWGLQDALLACASQPRFLNARSAASNDVLARMDWRALALRYGAPYVTVHRADLHRLLLDAALAQGVSVRHGATVTAMAERVATDAGVDVTWTQTPPSTEAEPMPHTLHAPWGIVADGVWSRLRQTVLGDAPPRWTGHIAYRALLPVDAVPNHGPQALRIDEATVWMGANMHCVCYPVSAGQHLNVVCLVEAPGMQSLTHSPSWNLQRTEAQTRADLQQALHGANAVLRDLLDACEGWRWWPLYGRPPMKGAHQHAQGHVALVGDAAHPMLPYLAQGAGMAIEDAHALAQSVRPQAEVHTGLQAFAHARWQRNARVQSRAMRNGDVFHARGLMRVGRDLGLRVLGERLMDVPWLYGHAQSDSSTDKP